jgi:hypothetical protein
MNMIELAAAQNNTKLFKWFINDLNLKHSRDFNPKKDKIPLHESYFLMVPFLLKNMEVFELILN